MDVNSPGILLAVKQGDETVAHLWGTCSLYPKGSEKVSAAALQTLKESTQVYQEFSNEDSMEFFWNKMPLNYYSDSTFKMLGLLIRELKLLGAPAENEYQQVFNSLPFAHRVYRFMDYFFSKIEEQLSVEYDNFNWFDVGHAEPLSKIEEVPIEGEYSAFDERPIALQINDEIARLKKLFEAFLKGDRIKLGECLSNQPTVFGLPLNFRSKAAALTASKVAVLCKKNEGLPFIVCGMGTLVGEVFSTELSKQGLTLKQIR